MSILFIMSKNIRRSSLRAVRHQRHPLHSL